VRAKLAQPARPVFSAITCRCTKLPEWLVDSMTSVVTLGSWRKKEAYSCEF